MPLDPTQISDADMRYVERAADLLLERCLIDAGIPSSVPNRLEGTAEISPFTYFGPWVLERAAQDGYDVVGESSSSDAMSDWEHKLTDQQMDVMSDCMESDDWRALDYTELVNVGTSARGERDSFTWARQNPAWKATADAYYECMEKLGYTFGSSAEFSPEVAITATGEQAVLIAVDEVECKDKVSLVQNLMDIVAAYELAFIDANEAALAEEQKAKKKILDYADLIVSRNS